MNRLVLPGIALLLAAVGVASCGSTQTTTVTVATTAPATTVVAPSAATTAAPEPTTSETTPTVIAAPTFDSAACKAAAGGLLDSLAELHSRLDVGMVIAEYRGAVQAGQAAYDRVNFRKLDLPCLEKVGVRLEAALNDYEKALKIWSDCIANYPCDFNAQPTDGRLQKLWSRAGLNVDRARYVLRNA